jgi:beta-glucosidase
MEGTMVDMGAWVHKATAILQAWYPGMEGGNALAEVLFGDVNPSGKLPCTFPKRLEDTPAAAFGPEAYPWVSGTVSYKEGLLVGYRWYDTKKIEPQFPFGYGLSYTRFKYTNIKVVASADWPAEREIGHVQFDVTNIGPRAGAEVAQLYVHESDPGLPRPEKELKGFKKVFVKPGETQTVSIPLPEATFAYYDPGQKSWVGHKGTFEIMVGGSSRDLPLNGEFTVPTTFYP